MACAVTPVELAAERRLAAIRDARSAGPTVADISAVAARALTIDETALAVSEYADLVGPAGTRLAGTAASIILATNGCRAIGLTHPARPFVADQANVTAHAVAFDALSTLALEASETA